MKSQSNARALSPNCQNHRANFSSLAVFIALVAVMSISGCTGLTGAGTPATNKTTSNAASTTGTGTLAANATSFTFGNVTLGSNSSQTLTLTNTGTATVTISQATVAGTGFSVVGGMSSVAIPAGQNHVFQLQFAPQAVGSASGSVAVSSDATNSPMAISLSGNGMTALAITAQPASQSVTAGQVANFSVAATGTGTLTYQWKKNGAAISGASSSSYSTPATSNSDNGSQFTVSVTDSTGTITSNAVTLTVTAAPVAPSITVQPSNQTVTAGQTTTFSVTATGTATLTYQWSKNGAAIAGATSASYTTPATTASDNGAQFTVKVTNNQGNVTSNAATLTVNIPPSITSQPASQSVTAGQTASFSVTATGTGPLAYQWKKNGAAIGGATSASYTTPATANSDNGAQFTVTVTNGVGTATSNAVTLTVTAAPVAPSITTQPANQTVTGGQVATFSVVAAGTATLTYQWKKNGAAIGGATSASYTTPATSASDNGTQFSVTVSNSLGNVTSNNATLTVNVPPVITSQPASQTVTAGQTATFSVTATSSGTINYQWSKNGTAIAGATAASYTTPATTASDNGSLFTVAITGSLGNVTSNAATLSVNVPPSITTQPASRTVTAGQTAAFSVAATGTATLNYQWSKNGTAISGATSPTYTTPATTNTDNGSQFSVTITNTVGTVTSNTATLTVSVPPVVTSQPANQTVTSGQTATFSVTATGTGTLSYQWKKNGTTIGGATSASYMTPATTGSDNGSLFTVTVTDTVGSITSNSATLTVNVPPTVTTQPAAKTVLTGQTATFSVTASGTASLAYQWNKNGAAIGGATSATYTTPATTNADNGAQFTVTITNSAGTVTSNAATLTVTAATLILNANKASLSFSSVNIGSNSVLGVTFTNAGNSTVTIAGVSVTGPGYTGSGVASGLILASGQTATLNVTFTPASAGIANGTATVTSNATNSPATISLSGTGVQPIQHSVTLTWSASTSSVSGYNVYRSTVSGGPYTKVNSSLIATTSYTDSTVQAGQTYYYVVTSVNSSNVESVYSTEVSATVPTP